MRRILSLALVLALAPAVARAQASPPAPADSAASLTPASPQGRWQLFHAPTGQTLRSGEVVVGASTSSGDFPQLFGGVGVGRLSLSGAYTDWPAMGGQSGAFTAGADLQLGSRERPVVLRAQAELPVRNRYGRRVGQVTVLGARRWGTDARALTVGGGWSGFQGLCQADWEGCTRDWHGAAFGLVGGYLPLAPRVELVSENYVRPQGLSVSTMTGLRLTAGGLTVGAALGCGAASLGQSTCANAMLTASYGARLRAAR